MLIACICRGNKDCPSIFIKKDGSACFNKQSNENLLLVSLLVCSHDFCNTASVAHKAEGLQHNERISSQFCDFIFHISIAYLLFYQHIAFLLYP